MESSGGGGRGGSLCRGLLPAPASSLPAPEPGLAGSPAPGLSVDPGGRFRAVEPKSPSLHTSRRDCRGRRSLAANAQANHSPGLTLASLRLPKSSRAATFPAQPHSANFSDPLFTQAWLAPPALNLSVIRVTRTVFLNSTAWAAPPEILSWLGQEDVSLLDPQVKLTCSQR